MYSVTKRIDMVKQPRGGYINPSQLKVTLFNDGIMLNDNENIHPTLIGLVVDYMTRFMMDGEKERAFLISLKGAIALDSLSANKDRSAVENAMKLLTDIKGIDEKSITNACKLVGYDTCSRSGIAGYKPVEEIIPDKDTIENIMTMINRSLSFWKKYGPVKNYGFTFEGGYTNIISKGDGDYLTKDTLWDFKVSKYDPKPNHTLQLLVYYIMGTNSTHTEFYRIKKLGIYNPRMNKAYTIDIASVPDNVIEEVSTNVIGY